MGPPSPSTSLSITSRPDNSKKMKVILEERGFSKGKLDSLKRECPDVHCPAGKTDCCFWRLLYTQPDFRGVEPVIGRRAKLGFAVLFVPVEQRLGRAKWHYRQSPPSPKEEDLEHNVLELLTLQLIRRRASFFPRDICLWASFAKRLVQFIHGPLLLAKISQPSTSPAFLEERSRRRWLFVAGDRTLNSIYCSTSPC